MAKVNNVLFISQDIAPFVDETPMSVIGRDYHKLSRKRERN